MSEKEQIIESEYRDFEIYYHKNENHWYATHKTEGRKFDNSQFQYLLDAIDNWHTRQKAKKFQRVEGLFADRLRPCTVTSIIKVERGGGAMVRISFKGANKGEVSRGQQYRLSAGGKYSYGHVLYEDTEDNKKRGQKIKEYEAKITTLRAELTRVPITKITDQEKDGQPEAGGQTS